jgi:hypothetical protein
MGVLLTGSSSSPSMVAPEVAFLDLGLLASAGPGVARGGVGPIFWNLATKKPSTL